MLHNYHAGLLVLASLLLLFKTQASQVFYKDENGVKSAVYLSPELVMEPGSVSNKFHHNIDFPRGHVALKELFAEVVDELGIPVPLHETYLHHWLIQRYHALVVDGQEKTTLTAGNSGMCQSTLNQYFGLGSETRRTLSHVPDPYGIEIGNPAGIPDGYEERWFVNIHAIDTRGAVDRLGCTECRCDLYNLTMDEYRGPSRPNYTGGLGCCYDETRCRVREGFPSIKRSLYLRYTVKWVDWDDALIPVKIYILDVTDTGNRSTGETSSSDFEAGSDCQVEYEVESCSVPGLSSSGCIHTKRASVAMPNGGYVIYGVAHQHTAGAGAALYGEDGRLICSSIPIYGNGKEAGNEAGYIVGMSTCYPEHGSVKISDGETLFVESNYSSSSKHTGVMGFMYLLVADQQPKDTGYFYATLHETVKLLKYSWTLALVGLGVTVVAAMVYRRKSGNEQGYQSI